MSKVVFIQGNYFVELMALHHHSEHHEITNTNTHKFLIKIVPMPVEWMTLQSLRYSFINTEKKVYLFSVHGTELQMKQKISETFVCQLKTKQTLKKHQLACSIHKCYLVTWLQWLMAPGQSMSLFLSSSSSLSVPVCFHATQHCANIWIRTSASVRVKVRCKWHLSDIKSLFNNE